MREERVQYKYNMVNTFLPYPDFKKTAQALDYKRLGKQRVEAIQILKANLGLTVGWANHPAAKMWRGCEDSLCDYALSICDEWTGRGYNDSIRDQVLEIRKGLGPQHKQTPWWIGNDDFHKSHQSNLKRKDPIYYPFDIEDNLPYLWPQENQTLKSKEQIHEDKVLLQDSQGRRKRRSLARDGDGQGT